MEKPLYHIGLICLIGGFLLSVICIIIGIFVYSAIPMWLDFPTYITRSYSSTTGIISDSFDPTGKTHVTGSYTINNISYVDYYSDVFKIGDKVTIKYLPHTKIIYSVEGAGKIGIDN